MTKFFNKFKNPCFWSIFPILGAQRLCHANLYRFLAPCQNLEKTNDTIPRKQPDRCKDGRMEGWAERRTDLLPSGDQKSDGNSWNISWSAKLRKIMKIVLWGFQCLEYKEGGKVTTFRREILNLERLSKT